MGRSGVLEGMGERAASGRYGRLDDTRLAALVRKGDQGAFEALYDRHHAPLLAFCRHMLGSHQDGEDVLQQTFLRAHRALTDRPAPDAMRPWLFAIARNRCLTLLAARREAVAMPEGFEPSFDGLAEDVGRRADLRELLHDLAKLPDDQREALVLFELGGSSQAEIARILACPPAKVKALVFQARTTLIAERDARSTPCEAIREQLAVARGGLLRRGSLRRHLRQCAPCEAYRLAVAGQREAFASLLPVLPTAGLKAAVLAAGLSGGGGSAAAAAGGAASLAGGGGAVSLGGAVAGGGAASAGGLAVTALVAKVAVTAAVAGAGISGAVGAVDAGSGDAAPTVRAAAPAATRTAEPPRRQAPARAPADPSTGTPGQPITTPAAAVRSRPFARRRAIRRRAARRARRATFRRRARRAALRPRAVVRPRSTALAPRREARREARRELRPPARREARREARRQARREAALPGAARPRGSRPGPAAGAEPPGPRPVRPRPQLPAPTPAPEITATPEASVAPTAVPTP